MSDRYRDRDWLELMYHGRELTQREIADRCGVSTRTIRRYMARFDIPTRKPTVRHHGLAGRERSPEVKRWISEALSGRAVSAETRQRMADAHRGQSLPEPIRERISESLTGRIRSKETRRKMSESTAGERNPNWKGGYSYRYGPGWSEARAAVRERDGDCQHCGHDGGERRLEVHHIVPVRTFRRDPDAELADAHDLGNLVLLCRRCHGRADHGKISLTSGGSSDRETPSQTAGKE